MTEVVVPASGRMIVTQLVPQIAVCICTYKRNEGLTALLAALDRQRLPGLTDGNIMVVIVDNSDMGRARPVCNDYGSNGRFRLWRASETRKGLAFARNAALAAAREAGATHIAFIDDDEMPTPSWLAELYARLTESGAAAAIGPVHPLFEIALPAWLPASAFVTRRAPKNGFVNDGYTCNCIIDVSAVAEMNLAFDSRYNHSGGEDTVFFKQLLASGRKIAWAERALVHDFVPRQRMSAKWLRRRWFRTGALEADLSRFAPHSPFGRAVNLTRGLARVGFGSVRVAIGAMRRIMGEPTAFVASFYTLSRGMGLISKVFGRDYEEYSVPSYR